MEALLTLSPLERVVAKYRRDVHHLAPGAPTDALAALEGHLGRRLPPDLRAFLARHNGGALFRGTLRIRSTSEITAASADAPQVALFADGQSYLGVVRPGDTAGEIRWGWAPDGNGGHAFGAWDGDRLEPIHSTFEGWLAGSIAVLESRVTTAAEVDAVRFDADPDDVHQMVRAAERALRAGSPEEAESLLRRATQRSPGNLAAWQYLGDTLAGRDRPAARQAWLNAFRATSLPLGWPGAPCLEPDLLRSLGQVFLDPEAWERELERFLADQVRDCRSVGEVQVVVAASTALARSRLARGKRTAAREALADLVSRCRAFTANITPWDGILELARLENGLGHHDEAEALLRKIRRDAPPENHGPALLLLGAIAVTRQEPWSDDILDEAEAAGLDDADRVRAACLRIERALRHERKDDADGAIEIARSHARRAGSKLIDALLALAEGDVARLNEDPDAARAAYERGLKAVDDRDPELKYRLHLRLGDLFAARGQGDDRRLSERHHRTARDGFLAHELPVREGWALVRIARTKLTEERARGEGEEGTALVEAARQRFLAADLAAGVAAVDSLLGDPGASLAWHLERSTAQARTRHDAQRPRPPYERPDADRPERRLGAHRLAIAACGVGVVQAIAREMEACARACAAGRGRALEPPVIRYVAAVDLLSGHASYEAAQALLRHLLLQAVDGVAWRALQWAIARSPNAALVDGLLRAIERPNEHPSHAVAAAAEVLGLRREAAALGALSGLAANGGPVTRKAAVTALGRLGNRVAVDAILPALEEPALAESAGLALLMLGDRRGVDFHARALVQRRTDLHGHPGEIVGRYGGPEYLPLLVSASEGQDDRALGALQGIGLLGDPRGIPALITALGSRDRRVVEVAALGLELVTGHQEQWEEIGARQKWAAWWDANGRRFPAGVRHRDGKAMDPGLLIERMKGPDAYARRTAYDELVITTGANLPFDADGPWRVQQGHLRAWNLWWGTMRHRMPAGRWILDGKTLA